MEIIRENEHPIEGENHGAMAPFLMSEEEKKRSEKEVSVAVENQTEVPSANAVEGAECDTSEKKKKCHVGRLLFDILMAAAVITLFILHFCGGKGDVAAPVADPATAGNGDIMYVNIDSINSNYEMVDLLTDSIDAEKQRQTVLFQNRQKALEQKLANYQRNMQSGSLNQQQAMYAEQSLQEENIKLQNDYQTALESLEARYTAALSQIADSLKAACTRVNKKHNASFVITYGAGSQLIIADPTKDITQEVLDDLNKPFGKKKKGGK